MAKSQKVVGFQPATARRILKHVGMVGSRQFQEWTQARGSGGQQAALFKLVEDFRANSALAQECDWDGTILFPDRPAQTVRKGISSRPAGAKEGYVGIWLKTDGQWRFRQGNCPDLSCDEAASSIDLGTPPEANVNEEYTHEIVVNDFASAPTITGLPNGLTATIEETDDDQWTITITGTPTTEGEFTIIVSGTTLENDCPMAAAFNLIVNPCDVGTSAIDIGELPEAEEFDEWDHEITFTDVADIEILGLPPEIDVTIDEPGGTITLDTDELPATGTYQVVIRGTSIPNGCIIEVEFVLRILPCDAGDSAIIGSGFGWGYRNDNGCFVGVPGAAQIIILDATDASVDNLPDWMDYEVIPSGDNVVLLITGTPPTGFCAVPFSAIEGWTEYIPAENWYYRDIEISATTLENDCTIKKTSRIFLTAGSSCPGPTDYATLEAEIAFSIGDADPGAFTVGVNSADIFNWNVGSRNVINRGVVLPLPPGLSFHPSFNTIYGIPDAGSEGTYVTTVYGEVADGPYGGCRVEFTYDLVIS